MTSGETMFVALATVMFLLFAAVVAWTDSSTREVREGKK
jgi:hypothetical protein